MTDANLALICDCDGVLVDSEATAGATIVRELEALWPGTEIEPVVTPLLGFRTERVLRTTAATLGKTLTSEQIGAIHRTAGAAASQAPMVLGIDSALASIPLPKACASNSYSTYVARTVDRTGLRRFFGDRLFTGDLVANPKPEPDVSARRQAYVNHARAVPRCRRQCCGSDGRGIGRNDRTRLCRRGARPCGAGGQAT